MSKTIMINEINLGNKNIDKIEFQVKLIKTNPIQHNKMKIYVNVEASKY